jgi:hypothetical protein
MVPTVMSLHEEKGDELYSYRISLYLLLDEGKIPLVKNSVFLEMKVF